MFYSLNFSLSGRLVLALAISVYPHLDCHYIFTKWSNLRNETNQGEETYLFQHPCVYVKIMPLHDPQTKIMYWELDPDKRSLVALCLNCMWALLHNYIVRVGPGPYVLPSHDDQRHHAMVKERAAWFKIIRTTRFTFVTMCIFVLIRLYLHAKAQAFSTRHIIYTRA